MDIIEDDKQYTCILEHIYNLLLTCVLQKIVTLEEELQKRDELEEDSGTESPAPGEEVDTDVDGTRQPRGHRRRRFLPSHQVSVKQEEVL